MLSIEEYLTKLRDVCKNPDAVDSIAHCFPTPERMKNLYEMVDEFGMEPENGYEGLVEIYHLSDAKAALERPNFRLSNWHYDRVSEHLMINLNKGVHEHLSADLWRCSHPEIDPRLYFSRKETEHYAELFIEEGLGWFRSTTSRGRALKGKDVRLNAQERIVFGDDFMDM